MPVQRTFLGRPVTFTLPPRRFQFVFALTLLIITLITLNVTSYIPADVPVVETVKSYIPSTNNLPGLSALYIPHNPFKPAAHKPPVQANSTLGENRWHIDWRWRNPFSSDVTLDDERVVLPPPIVRPSVYTYYESDKKVSKKIQDAEDKLLLAWRRAWWAQGFRPVILGPADATNNPLYKKVQAQQLGPAMEAELTRWVAWSSMGSGMLVGWMAYPMAGYDNKLLTFLRRGDYPKMNRFEGLGNAFYCGSKEDIVKTINAALSSPDLKDAHSLAEKPFDNLFTVESPHDAIAHYDGMVIEKQYKTVASSLNSSPTVDKQGEGLILLQHLINAHLHLTWQNRFTAGVAIIKPLPKQMTALVTPAIDIAGNLTTCPWSPDPTSCPPNNPTCKKCVSSSPLMISSPPTYRNKSLSLFQIGVVPHPFTTTSLLNTRDQISTRLIREKGMQKRDLWIHAITQDVIGTGPSYYPRLTAFKEAVSGLESGTNNMQFRTLWLTAENESVTDLDWYFGFSVPQIMGMDLHTSVTPVPGPERRPKPMEPEGGLVLPEELAEQNDRLRKAREFIGKRDGESQRVLGAVAAWNMADMEVWRFAKAWAARRVVERRKFEEEEGGFGGGDASERKASLKLGSLGRWFD